MARARSGVLHALFLLAAAAGGVQATFSCAASANPTTCNALLGFYNAVGGIGFFGGGQWFDQAGLDFCSVGAIQPAWSGLYCTNAVLTCAHPARGAHLHA